MYKILVNLFSAWFIWKWLKPRWRSTIAIVVVFFLSNTMHNDYLEFAALSGNLEYVPLSYIASWVIPLLAIIGYFFHHYRQTKANHFADYESTQQADGFDHVRQNMKTRQANKLAKEHKEKSPTPSTHPERIIDEEDDGFDFLRQKGELESKGDKITGMKKSKNDD